MPAIDGDSPAVQPPGMTVAEALALPVLRSGLPEVAAGAAHVDRPIRWVHAGEVPNIASLLTGGELLLTTGMGIGARRSEQRRFISGLAERGVAALVVELGATLSELPLTLVEAAEEQGLPLVALHREVPFVAVTEAIHTEIVNRHYRLMRQGEQIAHELSALLLEGGGIPEILHALSRTLENPVFLESGDGRLLYHAGFPSGSPETGSPLEAWKAAQAQNGRSAWRAGASSTVPSGGRAAPGRLVVLPVSSALSELTSIVLERAAEIIALALLRTRQEEELLARQRGNLLADMSMGRLSGRDAASQATLIGFNAERELMLTFAAQTSSEHLLAHEWSAAMHEIQSLLESRGLTALVGAGGGPGTLLAAVGMRERSERESTAEIVSEAIRSGLARRLGEVQVTIAVGGPVAWSETGGALALAAESAASVAHLPGSSWYDVESLEIQRLLWRWRGDPSLDGFVERTLAPLIDHDARHKHHLLPTLEALCANGGAKATTARELHLNRQGLYYRLQRIEQILGVDLNQAETMLALQIAVRALRLDG